METNCNCQLQTFLSSGFQPAPTSRTKTPPLSEAIRKIVPGSNSGELLITLIAVPEAYADFQNHSPRDFHNHSPTPGVVFAFF